MDKLLERSGSKLLVVCPPCSYMGGWHHLNSTRTPALQRASLLQQSRAKARFAAEQCQKQLKRGGDILYIYGKDGLSAHNSARVSPHSDSSYFAGQLRVSPHTVRGPSGVSPHPARAFSICRRCLWILSFHSSDKFQKRAPPEYPPTRLEHSQEVEAWISSRASGPFQLPPHPRSRS